MTGSSTVWTATPVRNWGALTNWTSSACPPSASTASARRYPIEPSSLTGSHASNGGAYRVAASSSFQYSSTRTSRLPGGTLTATWARTLPPSAVRSAHRLEPDEEALPADVEIDLPAIEFLALGIEGDRHDRGQTRQRAEVELDLERRTVLRHHRPSVEQELHPRHLGSDQRA